MRDDVYRDSFSGDLLCKGGLQSRKYIGQRFAQKDRTFESEIFSTRTTRVRSWVSNINIYPEQDPL